MGNKRNEVKPKTRTGKLVVHAEAASKLPAGYAKLLDDVKKRIAQSRVRAALSVNRELIRLYWEIGRLIVQRQEQEGWGKSVIERLASDVQAAFPGIHGFSTTNIRRMRAFYLGYTKELTNLPQPVRDLPPPILPQAVGELDGVNLPEPVAEIPWGHNAVLIEKLKDPTERIWYARKTTEHGWSRAVLVHQIESDLYGRQGQAITNFEHTLPSPQSDLAQQLLKDPYTFDFLGLTDEVRERELETSLIDHIQRFLLELGKGFAFVGRQHHMEVGGEDFYLDLLFYHLHLRCFVVIDLKVEPFNPEFAGKMSFYLSAVDDLLRHPDDNPTIGLILCKERNHVVVEYTLRDSARPLGVATYRLLPEELKTSLPSPEEFEAELRSAEGDESDEKTGNNHQ
jgi:predicted nuclease of restriction endonuclease-like (RecB) superfamily